MADVLSSTMSHNIGGGVGTGGNTGVAPDPYRGRVASLHGSVTDLQNKYNREKRIPIMVIIGSIVPVVIFITLFFWKPKFVREYDSDLEEYTEERDTKKIFSYTLIISLVVWVGLYVFSMYVNV